MEDEPKKEDDSDFYVDLGKDVLKATLISIVTVLVRSLSEILTSSSNRQPPDDHY